MANNDHQKQQFQDRLKRIRAGGPNTLGQVYVGVADAADTTQSKQKSVQSMSFMMLVLAFILGAMSMTGGRIGAFHFLKGDATQLIEHFGEIGGFMATNVGDIVIASLLAFIFMYLFRLRGNWRGTALVVGLVSMMVGETPLIQRAPEAFAILYSADFVETVTGGATAQAVTNIQDPSAPLEG